MRARPEWSGIQGEAPVSDQVNASFCFLLLITSLFRFENAMAQANDKTDLPQEDLPKIKVKMKTDFC